MASPTAGTVAARLADQSARVATLAALEDHSGAHPEPLALAAVAGLSELMALDASEVAAELFQRIGWLRARLVVEAADPAEMFGAAWSGGRLEAMMESTTSALGLVFAKAPEELDARDTLVYACALAMDPPAQVRGWTRAFAAAAGDTLALMDKWVPINPVGL